MTTYVLDVPVWATLRIEAENPETAMEKLAALAPLTTILVTSSGPMGDGVFLSEAATLYVEADRWPNTYDPVADMLPEEADE